MSSENQNTGQQEPADEAVANGNSGGKKSMRSRLTSAATWSVVGRVLSMGTFFGSHFLLGRVLLKSDYAAYVMVSVVASMSTVLLTFGTPQILIRAIRHNANVTQAVLSCLRLVLILIGIATVVLLIASGYLGEERKWIGLRDYKLWVILWLSCSALCLIASSTLQAVDDFRSAVLVGARNGGLLPNVLFFVLLFIGSRFEWLELGNVIALRALLQLVTLLIAATFISKSVRRYLANKPPGPSDAVEDTPDPTMVWFLLESWYTVVTQMVVLGMAEFDVLLVGSYVDDETAADYGVAKTLIALVKSPLLIAELFVGPFIAELCYLKQKASLESLLRGVATLIGLPALFALAVFMFFPEFVLNWTYGATFEGAIPLLQILALGQIVSVFTGCNGQALVMSGYQRELMGCSLFMLVIYILLAPWAIGNWGAIGGAWLNAALVAALNLIVTVMVKIKVDIWTTASPSYSALKYSLSRVLRRPAATSSQDGSPQNGS